MHVFNRGLPHTDSMYSFGYRLTGDDEDAKDLVQDTYMKSYRFIDSFEEGTNENLVVPNFEKQFYQRIPKKK